MAVAGNSKKYNWFCSISCFVGYNLQQLYVTCDSNIYIQSSGSEGGTENIVLSSRAYIHPKVLHVLVIKMRHINRP